MSNLNEIEQVLKAVGIELRDTPEHFRDIDSVLAEIAGKWNTFSDVQKSGISTAVAGTRQRENFLVLMENWDNVGKYAEIAANAYGTAVEKMEAYSQGVEAARKRVQAAWEGFALVINESGALEVAFNTLATAIENLHLIILSVIGALIVNNPEAALGTLTAAFTKLGTFLNTRGLQGMLSSGTKDSFTKETQANLRAQMAANAFTAQKQAMFGDYLGNFKGNLDNNRFAGMVEYQSGLIGLEKNISNAKFLQGLGTLAGGVNLKDTLKMGEGLRLLNRAVLTGEQSQIVLNTVTKEVSDALIKEKMAIAQGTTDEEKLAWARQAAAKDLLIDITEGDKSKYYDENARRTFTAATGTGTRGNELEQREMQNRAYASMAGSIVGMYGARTLLGNLAAGVGGEDARSAGESIGSVIGMFAGEKAASSLFTAIKGVARGTMASSALAAPILGVVALAIGAIIGLVSAARKKEIEKAQNEFKELKDTYESQLSGSTKTSRYDELSEGVDQFGRNVSLTDEEYSEFLSTSNELAELFPELVVRTDEAGNSFLGTAGKVGKLTEAVEEMVKASQKAADQQLLSKDVFGEAFDDAKKEAKNNIKSVSEMERENEILEKALRTGYVENSDTVKSTAELQENYRKRIASNKLQIDKQRRGDTPYDSSINDSLTDYNNAIIREDFGLQATLSSMSEDSAILAKQTMQKAFSSLDLTEYANEDEYRADIEKISNEIANIYKDNPIIATMEVEMSSSATSGEYYAVRQQILQNIIEAFGDYAAWDETQKAFVLSMGFKMVDGEWIDTTDIRQKIKDEGLNSHLGKDVNLNKYSVNDLETAYTILKGTFADNVYSDSGLQNAIFQTKYQDVELSKAAQLYEQYTSIGRELTEVEKVQKDFIEKKLDKWASELDVVQGDYDEIIRKAKIIGNLDFGGVSTLNPDENWDRLENYAKWAKYLEDERLKTGKWDIETLNQMSTYSELQPFIANDDAEGMLKYLNEVVNAGENSMNQSYQKMYTNSKEGTKALQELHKDLLDEVEEDYGIDFREFETASDAKVWLAKYSAAIASQNWSDWKDSMIQYYQDVLAEATTDTQKMILLNGEVIKQVKKAQMLGSEEYVRRVQLDYKANGGDMSDVDAWNEYLNQQLGKDYMDQTTEEMLADLDEAMTKYQNGKKLNLDSKDKRTSDLNKEIERIEALIGMYQKEYYLRKSLIEQGNLTAEGQDSFMGPEYYDRMRSAYEMQANYYKQRIPWDKDISQWSAEQMGYYQKYQQAMINLNNLDDEQVEDKINILQLQDVSYDQLIAAQRELLATSDTLEEEISRRKEINNLIKQQIELQMDVQKWQREIADIALEYEKGTPDTSAYESLIAAKRTSLQADLNTIEARLNWIRYDQSDEAKQYRGSKEADQEIRDKTKQWLETYQELASIPLDVLNDKLDILERKLDLLEKSKPNEWGAYDQIENYYSSNINYLEQKATLIREQLEDVSMLTDEQVQDLVDQLNDVTVALHEAQMQLLEDQKNYKESQYDALVSKVQEYITELEDAMDEIEKAYEDELKPLEEANEERERAIKLEDLLAAKKKAAQEKEKVYRQGIGWVKCLPKMDYIG